MLRQLFDKLTAALNYEVPEPVPMREIQSPQELEAAIEASADHPVLVFKHSTRCPISARANKRVGEYLAQQGDDAPDVRMLKVVESREVSMAAADKLGVAHQSPQLILLSGGQSVWDTSHHNIRAENIDAALQDHAAT